MFNIRTNGLLLCVVATRPVRDFPGSFKENGQEATKSLQQCHKRARIEHSRLDSHRYFAIMPSLLSLMPAFVFTYHTILLMCMFPSSSLFLMLTLDSQRHPRAAEMSASLHIAGNHSSVLDTCLSAVDERGPKSDNLRALLTADQEAMRTAGVGYSRRSPLFSLRTTSQESQ